MIGSKWNVTWRGRVMGDDLVSNDDVRYLYLVG